MSSRVGAAARPGGCGTIARVRFRLAQLAVVAAAVLGALAASGVEWPDRSLPTMPAGTGSGWVTTPDGERIRKAKPGTEVVVHYERTNPTLRGLAAELWSWNGSTWQHTHHLYPAHDGSPARWAPFPERVDADLLIRSRPSPDRFPLPPVGQLPQGWHRICAHTFEVPRVGGPPRTPCAPLFITVDFTYAD